jgi:hypothetical protein
MCVALSRERTAQFIYFQKVCLFGRLKIPQTRGRRKPEEKIGSTKTTTPTLTFVTELLFALIKTGIFVISQKVGRREMRKKTPPINAQLKIYFPPFCTPQQCMNIFQQTKILYFSSAHFCALAPWGVHQRAYSIRAAKESSDAIGMNSGGVR